MRGSFDGVRMILRYNWPLYLAGLATTAVATGVATSADRRPAIRTAASAAAVGTGWLAIASLAASWWVYDRSELYRWTWLSRATPQPPDRVLVVHAGLDEASEPVRQLWPHARVDSIDAHRGVGPTTASLKRARDRSPSAGDGDLVTGEPFDVAVVFLAAHEIRSATGRTELLHSLREHVRPDGRVVLIEHVRDLANALAYGPAIGHFYPVRHWRTIIRTAGLDLVDEQRITPFVVVLTANVPR